MKKYIIILFIIFYGIFNISPINALNNCEIINKEINNYPSIKDKIDNLFTKFSSQNNQLDSYEKIGKILDKYNKIFINKNISQKTQVALGYMQCQNNEKLQLTYTPTCSLIDFDINEEKYGKFEDYTFSDDLSKKIIFTVKGKYDYVAGIEKFIGNKYILYYINNQLSQVIDYDYAQAGFLDNGNTYIYYTKNNLYNLMVNNKEYSGYDYIYKIDSSLILTKNKKTKIIFSDGSISDEYDTVLGTVKLVDGTNISLVGKGVLTDNGLMDSNTFKGEYYLLVNGKEILQDNISAKVTNQFNMHSCLNKYGYSYTGNDGGRYFIFDGITYGGVGTKHINNYGYTQSNCEPIFVSILNNNNTLYSGTNIISQSNTSISRVKTHGTDIYYLKYKHPTGYQLFKNEEFIEGRGWVQKYGFNSKGELNYGLRIRDQTGVDKVIIHDSKGEYEFNGYTHIDRFEQYENDNYIYEIRGTSEDLVLNGKKINNPGIFYNGDYKNGKFFSLYKEDDSKYSIYIDIDKVELTEGKINVKEVKNKLFYRIKDDNRDKAVVQCG